jgi:hypothetical protein
MNFVPPSPHFSTKYVIISTVDSVSLNKPRVKPEHMTQVKRKVYCNRPSLSGRSPLHLSGWERHHGLAISTNDPQKTRRRSICDVSLFCCTLIKETLSKQSHSLVSTSNETSQEQLRRRKVITTTNESTERSFRRHSDNVGCSAPWNVGQYPPNYKEQHSDWCFGSFPKFLKAEVRMWPSNKQQLRMSISLFNYHPWQLLS